MHIKPAVFLAPLLALASPMTVIADGDLDSAIQKEATGVGRFKFGGYARAGFAKGQTFTVTVPTSNNRQITRKLEINGFPLELGGYGRINLLEYLADLEFGGGYKYQLTGESESNEKTALVTYQAATAYGGLSFQVSPTYSLAFGVFKDIAAKAKLKSKSEEEELDGLKFKVKKSSGAYLEWQWLPSGRDKGAVAYARAEYELVDLERANKKYDSNIVSISIGARY